MYRRRDIDEKFYNRGSRREDTKAETKMNVIQCIVDYSDYIIGLMSKLIFPTLFIYCAINDTKTVNENWYILGLFSTLFILFGDDKIDRDREIMLLKERIEMLESTRIQKEKENDI